MKSKAITIIIFFVLGWFINKHYLTSPESEIKALLKQASQLATVDEETSKIERAAQAHKLSLLFNPSASFEIILNDESKIYIQDRKEIKQKALLALTTLKSFEVSSLVKKVQVDKEKAQASVIGSASGSLPKESDRFIERHELLIDFALDEKGEWKISSVTHVENLRE